VLGRPITLLLFTLHFSMVVAFSTSHAEVWTDTDWSNNHWNTIELLDADTSAGELVLLANHSRFVLAFDATDFDGIWDLAVWQDRLYLAAGANPPLMTDGGEILVYDYQTNTSSLDYPVFEQGIVVLKVHDGIIYSPGVDSMGSNDWGNIYFNNGSGWVRKETIPEAVHVFDLFFRDDKIWVTTGQGYPFFNGVLFSSDDMGDSWVEEFAVNIGPPNYSIRRLYSGTVFNESIIIQPDFEEPEGRVFFEIKPDGTVVEHEVTNFTEAIGGYQEFNGVLWYRLPYALYSFDGYSFTLHDFPVGTPNYASRGITVFHDRLFISGRQNICSTVDGQNWDNSQIDQFSDRVFETMEEFHGRLFVGSNPQGEVFVTSVPESGYLIAEPYCFASPVGSGNITWQALLQGPNTTIKFQIRSAMDEAALSDSPFLGPDGTESSWYETSGTNLAQAHLGDVCFQYQVQLQSTDERFAPVLQEFSLEIQGDVSGIKPIQTRETLTAQPNPFNPQTTISWEQFEDGVASVEIFDLAGKRIATLVDQQKSAGKHSIIWNGCDQSGLRQAAGVYLVGVRHDGVEEVLKLVLVS